MSRNSWEFVNEHLPVLPTPENRQIQNKVKDLGIKIYNKISQGKISLLGKPDGCSWKTWHHKLYFFFSESIHCTESVSNKRHNCWLCDLWQQPDWGSHSWIWRLALPRSWCQAAAALCWVSCGHTLSCCCAAGWRPTTDAQIFHLGWGRATSAAVAPAAAPAAMPAVLGLMRTGTAGSWFHMNGAVVVRAKIRAVWGTAVGGWGGKQDLKKDEQVRSGMEK